MGKLRLLALSHSPKANPEQEVVGLEPQPELLTMTPSSPWSFQLGYMPPTTHPTPEQKHFFYAKKEYPSRIAAKYPQFGVTIAPQCPSSAHPTPPGPWTLQHHPVCVIMYCVCKPAKSPRQPHHTPGTFWSVDPRPTVQILSSKFQK